MNSVQVKVAEQIAGIAPKVEDSVVEVLVTRELDRRSNGLVNVMDKLSKLEAEFKRIRPDQVSYDEKGVKTQESFSKAKLDERSKAEAKINKFSKAINKALENNDYGEIYGLASGKDTPEGGPASPEEATETSA